ncbi:hypothetical protein C8R44DRAFT_870706 [Mycena epipterygia]|nr:hypothetical protein C8R44DRAFT_870706 [Mycena epipterygia]
MSTNVAENDRQWARLQHTLDTPPHLIRHIRPLDIAALGDGLSAETFVAICNFPFTHLGRVLVNYNDLILSIALALQQLLSLPTLRHLRIKNLRHLELCTLHTSPDAPLSAQHYSSPIRLESLHIQNTLDAYSCFPFDLSHLKALSVSDKTDVIQSPNFMVAHQTIEILDLAIYSNQRKIDLSSFPRLSLLRIFAFSWERWPCVLRTLSSISPSNCIRTLTLRGVPAQLGGQLDGQLASLPTDYLTVIEFR